MIPVYSTDITVNDSKYIETALKDNWVSFSSPMVTEFEERWMEHYTSNFAVGVSSGTSGLDIAISALDLPVGSEVIIPNFTIISCANAVSLNGHIPIPVDCDPDTWGIDIDQIQMAITPKTRAIMVCHLFGNTIDMELVMKIAQAGRLKVIEDFSQAQFVRFPDSNQFCGTMGDVGVTSLYANKTITTGEGGMIITQDPILAQRSRSLRDLGGRQDFLHDTFAMVSRMSGIQAALGLAMFDKLWSIIQKKAEVYGWYQTYMPSVPGMETLSLKHNGCILWMYGIITPILNTKVIDRLAYMGIQARPFFKGIHQQPIYEIHGEFPATEKLSTYGLYLPSGLRLTESHVQEVCNAIRKIIC